MFKVLACAKTDSVTERAGCTVEKIAGLLVGMVKLSPALMFKLTDDVTSADAGFETTLLPTPKNVETASEVVLTEA